MDFKWNIYNRCGTGWFNEKFLIKRKYFAEVKLTAKQATFELQLRWNSLDTKGKLCLGCGENREGKQGLGYF